MRHARHLFAAATALLIATSGPATAQDSADTPAALATSADVQTQVAAMAQAMKPGQGFLWQPLVKAGKTVAALEYWKKPGKPALHPEEAEYAIVVEGTGALVSGGTLIDAGVTQPGLTEGSRIEGGTTRTLAPGDVLLVPAGVPHWFGITGDHLVLLGIKIPATTR